MFRFLILILIFSVFPVMGFVGRVEAQQTVIKDFGGDNKPESCKGGGIGNKDYCGNYNLGDVSVFLVKIAQIIFGLVGSLSFLAFVYGGFLFLVSAGNNEQVTKAKSVIFGSLIGLLIVFLSYSVIFFVLKSLGIDSWSGGTVWQLQ